VKAIHCYSETKLAAMSPDQLRKAFTKLLIAAANNIHNPIQVAAILKSLGIMCNYGLDEICQNCHDQLSQTSSIHEINAIISCFLNAQNISGRDDHLALKTGDGNYMGDETLRSKGKQVAVVLDNLRSVFNTGSIFRSSECLGIDTIYLCGSSPSPENTRLHKTAMGTVKYIAWQYYSHTIEAVNLLKDRGYTICALETATVAESVFEYQPKFPLALVLGNESLGIDPLILQLCDSIVHIPVAGWKNSLNVGVAFGIAAYQIMYAKG